MKKVIAVLGFMVFANLAWSLPPEITPVSDQRASKGESYTFRPSLTDPGAAYWIKTFGPDEVNVHPTTGTVSWQIPSDLPGESFHIGVKAINSDGVDEDIWILTVGDGQRVYIGPDDDLKTLKDGMAFISPGDTLVMRNGLWDHNDTQNTIPGTSNKLQYLKGGDETAFTTLMAEDPGQVIIDGQGEEPVVRVFGSYTHPDFSASGSIFSGSTNYIAIKGLVVTNSTVESLRVEHSHHVKLINIGVGPSDTGGNGSYANVYIHKSRYVLIEGMYAWGHGRYKIQYKNSTEGIVRRCIIRIDDYTGALPLGGYMSYCSQNILFQNNIMVDSDQSQYWFDHYELTNAFGIAATNCYDYPLGNVFKRSLSLNTHMGLMKADVRNTLELTLWENLVGWDMKPDRQGGGTTGAVPLLSGVTVSESNNITFGDILLDGGDGSDFYLYSRDGTVTLTSQVKDSIFYRLGWNGADIENRGDLIRNTGSSKFEFINNNIYGFTGELIQTGLVNEVDTTTINPKYRYITMLPRDSKLRTMAEGGRRMGAEIMTFIGRSGTFYDDDGYDEETDIPMWPLPTEGIAHDHMGAFSLTGDDRNGNSSGITGARGFAVDGQSLTNYVWGYLGEPTPPFNVRVIDGNQQAKIMWEPLAEIERPQLSGFNIYTLNEDGREFMGQAHADDVSYTVTNLENGTTYQFAVTTVMADDSESDYGFSVESTPVASPRPKPPVLTIK